MKPYPRLTAALLYAGNLSHTEAHACMRAIATRGVESPPSSEAVAHFGGHRKLLTRAWELRNMARRFGGAPMWTQWQNKPMSVLESRGHTERVQARFAQMLQALDARGCDKHYSRKDLSFDLETISKSLTPHDQYIWFVRTCGTELIDLKLPRAQLTLSQVIDMPEWLAVFKFSLYGGLHKVTKAQATEHARRVKPYRVSGQCVERPNGDTLAGFTLHPTEGISVAEASIRLAGMEWSLFKTRRPRAQRNELEVIERVILDHWMTQRNSLFAKIKSAHYEIDAQTRLDSESFGKFYDMTWGTQQHPDMVLLKHQVRAQHITQTIVLPIAANEQNPMHTAKRFVEEFKKHIKQMHGRLFGHSFNLIKQE